MLVSAKFWHLHNYKNHIVSALQISRSNKDNLGTIIHFLHRNICFDPSLEPSHRDDSNEGSQHMFSLRNTKNYL